jgi:hypothetical protein
VSDDSPRKVLRAKGWKIYDTYKLTKPLTQYPIVDEKSSKEQQAADVVMAMWDQRHFFDWVYRGLNEALITDLLKMFVPN